MRLVLTSAQTEAAQMALVAGAARLKGDVVLMGQVRSALIGEDNPGAMALFAIAIPCSTALKIRKLLERERERLLQPALTPRRRPSPKDEGTPTPPA
jgi:hypothetical protein